MFNFTDEMGRISDHDDVFDESVSDDDEKIMRDIFEDCVNESNAAGVKFQLCTTSLACGDMCSDCNFTNSLIEKHEAALDGLGNRLKLLLAGYLNYYSVMGEDVFIEEMKKRKGVVDGSR